MGFIGILFFTIVQILFFSGLVLIWMRIKREQSEDSRWSRSLQIIQSKIAVFEDLSDRTETQVNQLTIMLENKMAELQRKIDEADSILNKISSSMKKSIEVAQIFQDKIPHEEIIERQNTVKFVKAALMANAGKTESEIAEAVNLPKSQIEFIVKVNSQRLSFDPSQIPDWLKLELSREKEEPDSKLNQQVSATWKSPLRPLNQLLNQKITFLENDHIETDEVKEVEEERGVTATKDVNELKAKVISEMSTNLSEVKKIKDLNIRPVVFPRIEKPNKTSHI